jgi:hypothetical protein
MSSIDSFYFESSSDEYLFWSWPQIFSDTTCGFGGIGGKAMVTRQTYLLFNKLKDLYHVYHNSRFAYSVSLKGKYLIEQCIRDQCLPTRKNAKRLFGDFLVGNY